MANAQRLHVLVVDRDESSVAEIKNLLSQDGYHVEALTEPSQVVGEIRGGRYQLVLLDVSPPGDGVELLGQIRSVDSDLCVIAMTNLPSVEVAVRTLKNQALDYAKQGIRVNCLCPGLIETPLTDQLKEPALAPIREQMKSWHAMGRLGRPEEVAACALFLASDDASFVTGHALVVDGGWTAGDSVALPGAGD